MYCNLNLQIVGTNSDFQVRTRTVQLIWSCDMIQLVQVGT
jgi:hypothetical protein